MNQIGAEAIRKVAERYGKTVEEIRLEYQTIIDQAWATRNPLQKLRQRRYFPKGKPTPEEFIAVVSEIARSGQKVEWL